MKLWTKVILAASVLWAIGMTIYAQMQVKEASKLGFELGVLDEKLIVAQEEAMRQADMAERSAADARRAQAEAESSMAEAQNQFRRAEEALAACQSKKK